jgi:hypothetical protein
VTVAVTDRDESMPCVKLMTPDGVAVTDREASAFPLLLAPAVAEANANGKVYGKFLLADTASVASALVPWLNVGESPWLPAVKGSV